MTLLECQYHQQINQNTFV